MSLKKGWWYWKRNLRSLYESKKQRVISKFENGIISDFIQTSWTEVQPPSGDIILN